jgi:hypothetical protein
MYKCEWIGEGRSVATDSTNTKQTTVHVRPTKEKGTATNDF